MDVTVCRCIRRHAITSHQDWLRADHPERIGHESRNPEFRGTVVQPSNRGCRNIHPDDRCGRQLSRQTSGRGAASHLHGGRDPARAASRDHADRRILRQQQDRTGQQLSGQRRTKPREVQPEPDTLVNYYPYVPGYYPDIVEQLSSGFFVVSGSAGAEPSRSGLAGPLDGDIALWPRDLRGGSSQSPTASCRSSSHRFTLSR